MDAAGAFVSLATLVIQIGVGAQSPPYGHDSHPYQYQSSAHGGGQQFASGTFESYYDRNTYLTTAQKAQFEDYWRCIVRGETEYVLQSLQWTAQEGHYNDYFMALNYLVYLHDNHLKSPKLLELIEHLIDQSIEQNIVHSPIVTTHSVTFNIVKYLLRRFRSNVIEPVESVPYAEVDFQRPTPEDINRLIAALGPSHFQPHYHTLVVNYLRSLPGIVYHQLNCKPSPITCLKHVFTRLLKYDTQHSAELRQAGQYYLEVIIDAEMQLEVKHRDLNIIKQLASFVPHFSSPHRGILLNFLTSGEGIYDLVKLVGQPIASEEYLKNLLFQGLSFPKITGPIKDALNFYLNYFRSLNTLAQMSKELPHFANSEGREYHALLSEFMNGPEFRNFVGTLGTDILNVKSEHLLQNILNSLVTCSHVSSKIKTAASYYLEYYDIVAVREKYSVDQLFSLIPQPTLSSESVYYENMQKLFESTEFLQVIKQSNIKVVDNQKAMLHNILSSVLKSSLFTTDCKETVLHYFELMYNEGLTIEQEERIEYLLDELSSIRVEKSVYDVISSFLRSDLAYLVFQEGRIDFTQTTISVLEEICEIITHMEYLEISVREAAQYYKTEIHKEFQIENEIIRSIHQAFTSLQGVSTKLIEKYEMDLDVFLQCDEMHTIIRHGHFNASMDARELLYNVLTVVQEDVNISMEIREGAYHYSKYILEPLLGNVQCNTEELLQLLPQPTNQVSDRYFNILKMYLQQGIPRFLISRIDFTKTRLDLLLEILQAIVFSDRIPVDIRGTARYYWHFFNTYNQVDVGFLANKLDTLTLLLPKPSSAHEAYYYNIMMTYLKGDQIQKLLNTISINLHKPDVRILRDVLVLTLNTKMVYMDVKLVARYYLTMIDNGIIGNISNVIVEELPDDQVGLMRTVGSSAPIAQVIPTTETLIQNQADQQHYATARTVTTDENFRRSQLQNGAQVTATQTSQHASQTTHVANQVSQAPATSIANIASTNFATTSSNSTSLIKATAATSTTSTSSTQSRISSTQTASTATMSGALSTSTSLTVDKVAVLQKMETALNQIGVAEFNIPDRTILLRYLRTDLVYNILITSGVNLEESGNALLCDFIGIAAHTNDIPLDLRLASEHYELLIPSLKTVANLTPHMHLTVLDIIFHKIGKLPLEANSQMITSYKTIDRYLHTEVPSMILKGAHVSLEIAPMELLQDMLLLSKECNLSQDDIVTIQTLMQRSKESVDSRNDHVLDHLYRLHKVFQLIKVPSDQNSMEYYYTIDNYFKSNIIYEVVQGGEVNFNQDLNELLKSILILTIKSQTLSSDIMQAAAYFNNLMFTPTVEKELDIVFHLIPQPVGVQEMAALETVNQYIHSPQVMDLAQIVNFDVHRQPPSILTNVLDLASHNSHVSSEVKHAAGLLLNRVVNSMSTSTTSETSQTKRSIFSHSSVHSMKSLSTAGVSSMVIDSTASSTYGTLLNILPESYATSEDFLILKEYFARLTPTFMQTLITHEEMTMLAGNEEGMLRLILLKCAQDVGQPANIRIACAHLIRQRYFDCSAFIEQLPGATFPEERNYRTLVTQLLTGDDVYRYVDLSLTQYETSMDSFRIILTKLSACEELSMEVRQACSYYLSHAPFFDYGSLTSLLPAATRDNIKKLHATMVHFLNTKELINRCTRDINVAKFADARDLLLKEILLTAEKCDWLDESIRVAAKYYLTVFKSVAISMRKVLTKTLDLGDIFNDAFDFSSFSKAQFDAYHGFWSYVSPRTEELLSSVGFDFWMHNNKRGEFTSKFLVALSAKADVPQEIMEDIVILKPLVLTINGGALDV